jgi:hypothetical protein
LKEELLENEDIEVDEVLEILDILEELDGTQSASTEHPSSPGPGKIAH